MHDYLNNPREQKTTGEGDFEFYMINGDVIPGHKWATDNHKKQMDENITIAEYFCSEDCR